MMANSADNLKYSDTSVEETNHCSYFIQRNCLNILKTIDNDLSVR